jgi:hypothetical protein
MTKQQNNKSDYTLPRAFRLGILNAAAIVLAAYVLLYSVVQLLD